MLTIALCDDEPEQRSRIGAILQNYSAARPELAVKISTFAVQHGAVGQVIAHGPSGQLRHHQVVQPHLLDIVMPVMSGIDLGVRLRELGYRGAMNVRKVPKPSFLLLQWQYHTRNRCVLHGFRRSWPLRCFRCNFCCDS